MPGLPEIPSLQIIDTTRRPERRAQSKESLVTDIETVITRTALKEMIAAWVRWIIRDLGAAAFLQRFKALGISAFKRSDLFRRKPLCPDLLVPHGISIIPQVQKRIKAEVVLVMY